MPLDAMAKIEVGAADDSLRLWRAKEAVRQGELLLAAQAQAGAALEARGTAMVGWTAATLLGAIGAAVATPEWQARVAALAVAAVLAIVANLAVFAIRPRGWSFPAFPPDMVLANPLESEMEILEAAAGGLANGYRFNEERLNATMRLILWAGWGLAVAPLFGCLAYLIVL